LKEITDIFNPRNIENINFFCSPLSTFTLKLQFFHKDHFPDPFSVFDDNN